MIRVVHEFNKKKIEGQMPSDNFILSNNIGGYVSFSETPVSKHQGLVFFDGREHFESLNNISPNKKVTKIINHFTHIDREFEDGTKDKLIYPTGHNSLIYELNKTTELDIVLDCRKVDDMRQFGRYYDIKEEDGNIIIEFIKTTDSREDQTHDNEEFRTYIILHTDTKPDYDVIREWFEENYSYDERRIFLPEPRYVFKALKLRCKNLICALGSTKAEAMYELDKVTKNYDYVIEQKSRKTILSKYFNKPLPKEEDFARLAAINSLLDLRNDAGYDGIYAGFYWFRQFWSRDELISLNAFIKLKDFKLVKDVIFRWLDKVQADGRLPNRFPASHLGSADSIGWLFKRIDDYLDALENERQLNDYLSFNDMVYLKNKVQSIVYDLLENHSDNSFMTNEGNETWMDTAVQANLPREGVMLEIQALQLCIYRVMGRLCKITDDKIGLRLAKSFEKELKQEVRRVFWTGDYLKDGAKDSTIRPNIFIVQYVYPELLTKSEWKKCFDFIIPKLWLDWGGLSSIDTSHRAFQRNHLGEGSISYHQGDSWFWINNLAALCLKTNFPFRFRNQIDEIKQRSIKETLWDGLPGHHAEISSAERFESFGCFAQAWSAALLLELLL